VVEVVAWLQRQGAETVEEMEGEEERISFLVPELDA